MKRSLRWQALDRDNYTCQYCGRAAPDVVLEVDHVTPKSRGGPDKLNNLKTSCWDCNRGKNARDSTDGLIGKDWIASLRGEVTELSSLVDALEESRLFLMLGYLVTTYAQEHEIDEGDVLDWLMTEVAA
jgi:hypothetical protein